MARSKFSVEIEQDEDNREVGWTIEMLSDPTRLWPNEGVGGALGMELRVEGLAK